MKILITGDLAITQSYNSSNLIDQSVVDLFASSEINIVNLEAPVTHSTAKILKTGPNIKSSEKSLEDALKILNITVATLANNHLLDYDEQGVIETLAFCKDNGVKTVGGGVNIEEASKILYLDSTEGKIAIVNFAENEWLGATKNSAGFNPMDIIDNVQQIKSAKEVADFVFVIIHGGHEYYNLPSPRMQKQYRYYAEHGADLVISHHTHCPSGFEIYNNVPIYYSLGNFIFTHHSNHEDWYLGLILEISLRDGKIFTNLQPVKQGKDTFELKLLKDGQKKIVLERVYSYNEIIIDTDKLHKSWENFSQKMYKDYIDMLSPISYVHNRYIGSVLRRLPFNGLNKKGLALILNLMRCEAHADLSKEVIKRYLNK
jgi:hypothetical protein